MWFLYNCDRTNEDMMRAKQSISRCQRWLKFRSFSSIRTSSTFSAIYMYMLISLYTLNFSMQQLAKFLMTCCRIFWIVSRISLRRLQIWYVRVVYNYTCNTCGKYRDFIVSMESGACTITCCTYQNIPSKMH